MVGQHLPEYERYTLAADRSKVSRKFDELGLDGRTVSVGIMGGTFDPIHIGHLLCAEYACEQFGLEAVIFMPTGRPPWKLDTHVACAEDRYIMARLAVEDNPRFDVSPLEARQDQVAYTVETLRELRRFFPRCVELAFILGADAARDIGDWYGAGELAGLASYLVASRSGYELVEVEGTDRIADDAFRFERFDMPEVGVSSSTVRDAIASGRSIRYQVPERVRSYIEATGLYR